MSRAPRTALLHIERLLVELHAEESSGRKSSIRISSLILQIFSQVESVARKDSGQSSSGPVSVRVNRVIEEGEFASITPGSVAKRLNRSLDHLNRQLREETGMSVGQTISRRRLDQAMKLLRNRTLPIGEVASAVGIDDQNYFSRWFRQKAGQTPTRWRDAMQ
jgi:AraC family L-rhamnose operon transcriptional activator RhaR